MDSSKKARRGSTLCTWDRVYLNRRNEGTIPESMKSPVILRCLLEKDRLPRVDAHNFTGASSPFMDLEAEDEGFDIQVSMRLRKGCNIRRALALLGEALGDYAEGHRGPEEPDAEDLKQSLFKARQETLATERYQKTKRIPDINRAAGLFLWDEVSSGKDFNDAVNSLFDYLGRFDNTEAKKTLQDTDQESLRRLCKSTGQWIADGKAGPLL